MADGKGEMELVPQNEPDKVVADKSEEVKKSQEKASVFELFSTADSLDVCLMLLGIVGGLGTGLSMPLFNVLFGIMLNHLNSDPNSLVKGVEDIALVFVWVAIGNFVCGFLQVL
jgi:ATP-binding cassette subfamily B (MDR/TAP) protein 1